MTEAVDVVVIGAGVVGLATARELAAAGREVLVLEASDTIGTGISARNSEVIHAGLYYASNSVKARTCRDGSRALYDYCREHNVRHHRVGKLVVATGPAECLRLEAILAQAHANGAQGVRRVTQSELTELEPEVVADAALWSPDTGIVDSHGFMRSLRRDVEAAGGDVVLRSEVLGGDVTRDSLVLHVADAGPVRARTVIVAAGLETWNVVSRLKGFPADALPPRFLAKGSYFQLTAGVSPFAHLVYPVPSDGGLGVHATLDLDGNVRFGPDVEWVDDVDYSVDASRAQDFTTAIARYWPHVADRRVVPAYAGVRPKLGGPGTPPSDFLVQGPARHSIPNLVNLFGIESPGLTASLALAAMVTDELAV